MLSINRKVNSDQGPLNLSNVKNRILIIIAIIIIFWEPKVQGFCAKRNIYTPYAFLPILKGQFYAGKKQIKLN